MFCKLFLKHSPPPVKKHTKQMIQQSAWQCILHRIPLQREREPTQQTENDMKNLLIILFVSGFHSFQFFPTSSACFN